MKQSAQTKKMAEKIWGGYVTSISVKNFNFDELIFFLISAR